MTAFLLAALAAVLVFLSVHAHRKLVSRTLALAAAVCLAFVPATLSAQLQAGPCNSRFIECPGKQVVGGAPGHGVTCAKYSCDPVVEYALVNRQQEGRFYFFPFPNEPAMGRSRKINNLHDKSRLRDYVTMHVSKELTDKAAETQTILKVLAAAENIGIHVASFQVDRDADSGDGRGYGAIYLYPVIHGIFVQAVPKGKETR